MQQPEVVKVTDRQRIIQALECCFRTGRELHRGGCERCPYYDPQPKEDCQTRLDRDVLELLVDQEIREGETE